MAGKRARKLDPKQVVTVRLDPVLVEYIEQHTPPGESEGAVIRRLIRLGIQAESQAPRGSGRYPEALAPPGENEDRQATV